MRPDHFGRQALKQLNNRIASGHPHFFILCMYLNNTTPPLMRDKEGAVFLPNFPVIKPVTYLLMAGMGF
jgi:hypothetical protein